MLRKRLSYDQPASARSLAVCAARDDSELFTIIVSRSVAAAHSTRAAASPLQQTAETTAVFSFEGSNPQNVQNAKLMPLRNIPKLFCGPSITPKLKSLIIATCRENRNSRPAPN